MQAGRAAGRIGLTSLAVIVTSAQPDIVIGIGCVIVIVVLCAAGLVLPAVWSRRKYRRDAALRLLKLLTQAARGSVNQAARPAGPGPRPRGRAQRRASHTTQTQQSLAGGRFRRSDTPSDRRPGTVTAPGR